MMTKAEILIQIKKAEEDARSMISEGNEAKAKKILEARSKAREIINIARQESIRDSEQKISQAKDHIRSEKKIKLQEGDVKAESIIEKANNNIAKATDFLIDQFERAINA